MKSSNQRGEVQRHKGTYVLSGFNLMEMSGEAREDAESGRKADVHMNTHTHTSREHAHAQHGG